MIEKYLLIAGLIALIIAAFSYVFWNVWKLFKRPPLPVGELYQRQLKIVPNMWDGDGS